MRTETCTLACSEMCKDTRDGQEHVKFAMDNEVISHGWIGDGRDGRSGEFHQSGTHRTFDLLEQGWILHQCRHGLLFALSQPTVPVKVIGTALGHQTRRFRSIQQRCIARHSLPKHDLHVGLPIGWEALVLDRFHTHGNSRAFPAVVLQDLLAPDLQTQAGIVLECIAAAGHFWVPVHHPDVLTELIDEDHAAIGTRGTAGDLS
mmetsp:Transcript_4691/g.29591  ORF Transcript_4691/g.29591 Transcript_4691/m.29591 type:complete len:204 (-) Transcript_4691:748-1359(-)